MTRQFWESPIVDTHGLDKCPHCGSDAGICIKFADVVRQYIDWDGYPIEANNDEPLFRRQARCMNCNKVVEKFISNLTPPAP